MPGNTVLRTSLMIHIRRPQDTSHRERVNLGVPHCAFSVTVTLYHTMNDVENVVDDEQPTESTALLSSRVAPQRADDLPSLPLLEPVILGVLAKGIASCTDADLCPAQFRSRAEEIAFSLIVLLYARYSARFRKQSRGDVLELWQAQQQQAQNLHLLDQRLLSLWSTFLTQCQSGTDVELVLWTAFPYEKQGRWSKRGTSSDSTSRSEGPHVFTLSGGLLVWLSCVRGISDTPCDSP